jgi:hypothetical protein
MSDAKDRALAAFDEFMDAMAGLRINLAEFGEDGFGPVWTSVDDPPPAAADLGDPMGGAYLIVLETAPFYLPSEGRAVPGRRHVAVGRMLAGKWFADGWRDDTAPDGSPRHRVTHWAPMPDLPDEAE